MNPSMLVSFLPVGWQPLAANLVGLAGAFWVVVNFLDKLFQILKVKFPGAGWISVLEHWLSFLATRWPKSLLPPQQGAQPGQGAATSGSQGGKSGAMAILLLGAALAASQARAQVVSSGPSLPMLEFVPGAQHPVSFAPGLGYDLSVGFLQRSILGHQYDLLDISGQVFGSATSAPNGDPAGSLQAALLVGTLNNVLAIGAAVPLYGGPQGGAFQGVFRVYPVLSLTIPIAIGPFSPPTGVAPGPEGLPRGMTVYLP